MRLYKNPTPIRRNRFSLNFSNKVQRLALQQRTHQILQLTNQVAAPSTGNCPARKTPHGCRFCK